MPLTDKDFTFNPETREIVYNQVVCRDCNGTGKVERGISCPRLWKTVKQFPGHKCPHCGAKNRNSHKLIGTEIVTCYECKGSGIQQLNGYDFCDFGKLFDHIKFVIVGKMFSGQGYNEQYLGIGIVAGVTDYGRYLNESLTDGKFDVQKFMVIVKENFEGRHRCGQGIGLTRKDGKLIKYAYIKMARDGWSAYASTDDETDTAIESKMKDGNNGI